MISYDFGMHRAGVFLLFSCSLAAPEVAVPTEGGCSAMLAMECCAITVWVTDSTSALAIMAANVFSHFVWL